MIRYVSVIRFKDGTSDEDAEAFAAAFMALEIEGMITRSAIRCLDLRKKDADFIIAADFEDMAAFDRYDTDTDHESLRAGLASRIIADGVTCLYNA
jgi:hypothetical protein